MAVFYPAVVSEGSPRFVLPFFTNLTLYKDAEIRLRRREASARDAVAWTRKHRALLRLVRKPSPRTAMSRRPIIGGQTPTTRPSRISPTVASGRYQTRHRLPAQRSRLEQICRCLPHRRRRPQPRRLHGALARPRQGQSRQVPHLPAGVAQQSANSPAHPGRAAARPRARAQRKGRPRQGGVCHGVRHHQGLRHGRGRAEAARRAGLYHCRRRRHADASGRERRVRGEIHSARRVRRYPRRGRP
jgi:hypothetical protein